MCRCAVQFSPTIEVSLYGFMKNFPINKLVKVKPNATVLKYEYIPRFFIENSPSSLTALFVVIVCTSILLFNSLNVFVRDTSFHLVKPSRISVL